MPRLTRTDYVIAALGMIPVLISVFLQPDISRWANVPPKYVAAVGIALSVALIFTLSSFIKKDRPKQRASAMSRVIGVGLLLVGAIYFFAREEIAELAGWRIEAGDKVMIAAGAVLAILISSSANARRESEDP